MLIKCPECELQVSDKAFLCPHCGYPLKKGAEKHIRRDPNKRRRLPNGFGQISKIKNNNLRKPFRALVTVGKNKNGRPVCKPLKPESYFQTYNDAYMALVEYNRNPYDLSPSVTVKELYERWLPEYKNSVKNSKPIELAWTFCSELYDIKVKELRARHIKSCLNAGISIVQGKEQKPSAYVKNSIKILFNKMLDYALEYELVDKNCSRTFNLGEEIIKEIVTVKREHLAFTDDEIKILWKHVDDTIAVDVLLIQCYSGWRPQEICSIRLKDVNIKEWYFIGGSKTDAGLNRKVPIHSKIRHLVERKYNEAKSMNSEFLFNYENRKPYVNNIALTYNRYKVFFSAFRDELKLNPEHRPHDGRKHFVTMAKKYNLDEYAIKYLVGHNISDITEKVYTQREFQWLRDEIEKIK